MNIFVLDKDPRLAAKYHCDKHVIKMILESAQMLCTVYTLQKISTPPKIKLYKPTHQNHPCTKWARESLDNWIWLKELAYYLNEEYKARYNHDKNHKSYDLIKMLPNPDLPELGLTDFRLAMPDKYKKEDPVESYRDYYFHEKLSIAEWSKTNNTPPWFIEKKSRLFREIL